MKPFWCRFYVLSSELASFEYHGPWWISGTTMDEPEQSIVCAAVMAGDELGAMKILNASFDEGHEMEFWDGASACEADWEPFSERFPRNESWMKWPWPVD